MNDPNMAEALGELLLFGSVGLVAAAALAALAVAGRLSLRHAPARNVALGPIDLIVAFALFFVGAAVIQVGMKSLGYDPQTMAENPRAAIMLIQQLLLHGPTVLYVIARLAMQPRGLIAWGLLPQRPVRELVAGGAGFLIGLPLVLALNITMVVIGLSLGYEKPETGHALLTEMRASASPAALAMMVISAVIIAPVIEEMVFRGLVQTVLINTLGRSQRWLALVIAAAGFAAVHSGVAPWQTYAGLFTLGLMFGWLYERHGSLLPGCVMHGLFNAANVGLVFVIPQS